MSKSSFAMRSRVKLKLGLVLVASAIACSACLGSVATPNINVNTGTTQAVPLDQQLLNAGISELSQQNFKLAIEDFNAAYGLKGATYKTRYVAAFDLGVLYVQQKMFTEAENAFQQSLAVNPKYGFALNDLAILESNTNPQLAISLYKRLLKSNPADRAQVYTSLGNLLIQTGNRVEGEKDLELADNITAATTTTTTVPVTPTS